MSVRSKFAALVANLRLRGLTLQLFLFVVLPITALVLAVPFGSLTLHGQAMRQLVAERDERAAQAAAAALSESLDHRAAAMRGLAVHLAGPPARAISDYAFLLDDFDGGLAVFASDGSLLDSTGAAEDWSSRPLADVLPRAISGDPAFSPTFKDPATGSFAVLVAASADREWVAVGAFGVDGLANRTLSPGLPDEGLPATWLVDANGQVLYQAGMSLGGDDLAAHPGVAEALGGERGAMYRPVGGNEHVIAFSPVPPVGWALVMEEPWELVEGPLLRRTQAAPLVLVPVVVFALFVLGFGIRQIVQPLQSLERQAAQLAWGRYQAIEAPVGGIGEIRRLQTELIHMARKLRAAQKSLRDYVSAITAAQEDERRRLARELHDDTIQSLIALLQRVQLARAALGDHPAAEALSEVQRMTGQAIEDVRRFTRALRPIYLEDLGLVPALDMLAGDTREALGIPVDFIVSGVERRLPPEVELGLYRMTQEALNNAARHAQAGHVWVRLEFGSKGLSLSIHDDGQGFVVPESPAEFSPRGHFGLLGMHERAELIGAQLSVRSAPGSGTTIEVRLGADGR